jgi:hypothetical protein
MGNFPLGTPRKLQLIAMLIIQTESIHTIWFCHVRYIKKKAKNQSSYQTVMSIIHCAEVNGSNGSMHHESAMSTLSISQI